jgi:hypothetical protein
VEAIFVNRFRRLNELKIYSICVIFDFFFCTDDITIVQNSLAASPGMRSNCFGRGAEEWIRGVNAVLFWGQQGGDVLHDVVPDGL